MYNKYRVLLLPLTFALLSGCASYGNIVNEKIETTPSAGYTIRNSFISQRSNDVAVILTFSGGGTRSAAFSYGALKALRDTSVSLDKKTVRLLDEVDAISSVSGGSFTAAYFGLHGDKIFTDFENEFLQRDVTGELMYGLFTPSLWFSKRGRTEMAVEFYEESVFKGATFSDLQQKDGPLIIINASDLGGGVRFSFMQEYFDLICSDLSSFPVARAVTASSAVPILFNPVVIENHPGCVSRTASWLEEMQHLTADSPQISHVTDALRSYSQKDKRRYIHLVDGGITDNLGLMAIYEMIEIAGGIRQFYDNFEKIPPQYFLMISINASTSPQYGIESTNKMTTMENTLNAVSDIQLHHNNIAILKLLKSSIKRWSIELSSPENPVTSYFVELDFNSIPKKDRRLFFNQIPTGFALSNEQVENLIDAGYDLLLNNPDFQKFIVDVNDTE